MPEQKPLLVKIPETFNCIIEIPRGSRNKYEYVDNTNTLRLDRVLPSSLFYPLDYGFIPETLSEDGDHLDVLVVISDPLFPGCSLTIRPIGLLDMEDEKGKDWKIIAIAEHDARQSYIDSVDDMGEHFKKEIKHFFEEYKCLENKKVIVHKWWDREKAYKMIEEAQERYRKNTL